MAACLSPTIPAMPPPATEGAQRGHMSLHARNVAIADGATGEDIGHVAAEMIARGEVREDVAREVLGGLG